MNFNYHFWVFLTQMGLFCFWIWRQDLYHGFGFLEGNSYRSQSLSDLLRFFPLWTKIWKNGRAIFHVFSRSGFKYEKTVELTLDSFSRSSSNMKREVEFIFRFRTLDPKMKTIPSVFYVATMLVKILEKQRRVFRHPILEKQWNDASDLWFLYAR